jgi:hypothetical protein
LKERRALLKKKKKERGAIFKKNKERMERSPCFGKQI